MAEIKMTKTEKFVKVLAIVNATETEETAMLAEFIQGEIDALARKAGKAKEKALARKGEVDELGEAVMQILTGAPQTCDQITETLANEEYTVAKVRARLTKLVNLGLATKTEVEGVSASGKKTTHMGYFVETAEETEWHAEG